MVNDDDIPTGTLLFAGVNDVVDMEGKMKRYERSFVLQFDNLEDARKALEGGIARFDWAWVRSKETA